MKYIYLFFILLSSVTFAYQRGNDTVIIQPELYPQYQPDNGPMRGPNSLEAHKYGYENWLRMRNNDYRYDRYGPQYYDYYRNY